MFLVFCFLFSCILCFFQCFLFFCFSIFHVFHLLFLLFTWALFISATIVAVKKRSDTGSFASVVVEEGGEAHTVNFVSAVLQRTVGTARQAEVEFVAMEAHRRRMWEMMGHEQCGSNLL